MMNRILVLGMCAAAACGLLGAAPFTPGNLVIMRVGTGSASLSNASTAAFLDEYTPSGTLVQSIALPTSGTALTLSGVATSEGFLTRSTDGQYLVFAGYSVAPGTTDVAGTTAAVAPRSLGRAGADGVASVTTTVTATIANGRNPRSAASDNGANLWLSLGSSGGGIVFVPNYGAANSSVNQLVSANTRNVGIFNGQLYHSVAASVNQLGTGLPTSGTQTATSIVSSSSVYAFFFCDLSPGEAGLDTLYIADDGSGGGIKKFSKAGGTWSQTGSTVAIANLRGLTGSVSGSTVTLYATSGTSSASGGGSLYTLTDSAGYSGALTGPATTLATAAANTVFRGVAFAPLAGNPSATGSATTVTAGQTTTFSGTITPGTNPDSTGLAVSCNLSGVGGSASYPLTVNVTTISGSYTVPGSTTPNTYSLPCTVSDAQGRSGNFNISLTVNGAQPPTNPSATGSATTVTAGQTTTFSGTIVPGTNPASTGLAVACNLSGVGGSASYPLTVNGTAISGAYAVPGSTTPNTYSLPCTVSDAQSRSGSFDISLTVNAAALTCGAAKTLIGAIQGTGASTAMAGQSVTIEGTVTGVYQGAAKLYGYYIQDEGDGNAATSDGIFINENPDRGASLANTVATGNKVRLVGTVEERFAQTTIKNITGFLSCGTGTVSPVDVSFPVAGSTALEAYEGMLVRFPQQLRVTDNYDLGRFGEVGLAFVPNYVAGTTFTRLMTGTQVATPGTAANAVATLNDLSRIVLDDGSNNTYNNLTPAANWPQDGGGLGFNNTLRLGDRVNVNAQGVYTPLIAVLGYGFSAYRIQPVTGYPITFGPSDNPRPAAAPAVGGRVKVMSANVLNYFVDFAADNPGSPYRGADNSTEFQRQRDKLVSAINAADAAVVAISELQNNATGGANAALADLVSALNAAVPNKWNYINTGNVGTDAIRVAFLYQPAVVEPVGVPAVLTDSVDPRALTTRNRPPVAHTFQRKGGAKPQLEQFTVVANHFKSKGSACTPTDPDVSDGQGNCNLTRVSIAQALIDWLATNPTGDTTAPADRRILIVGDLNAYLMEDPIRALTSTSFSKPGYPANPGATYKELMATLGDKAGYSYLFGGESGALDHALANPALFRLVTGVAEWHINADEPVVLDYNSDFDGNGGAGNTIQKSAAQIGAYYNSGAFRTSDHDPLLVGFNPLAGDLNDDGVINGVDQAIMRAAIGKPLATVDRRTDFDGDGRITLTDFQKWAQYASAYGFGRP